MDEVKKVEFTLVEYDVQKLNMQPGDTLVVKARGDELADQTESLGEAIRKVFPNNRVMVFFLPGNSDLDMEILSTSLGREEKQVNSCNSTNYCVDCNCGKKASAIKNLNNEEKDGN